MEKIWQIRQTVVNHCHLLARKASQPPEFPTAASRGFSGSLCWPLPNANCQLPSARRRCCCCRCSCCCCRWCCCRYCCCCSMLAVLIVTLDRCVWQLNLTSLYTSQASQALWAYRLAEGKPKAKWAKISHKQAGKTGKK